MTKSAAYALRLAISLEETARFFAERQERVDMAAFRALLQRKGGEPPRAGDEMPEMVN